MATTPKQMAAKADKTPKAGAETEPPADDQTTEQQTPPAMEPTSGEPAPAAAPAQEEPKSDAKAAADPADVAAYCAEHGAPKLAAELIRRGATMEEVEAKVGAASEIRSMCKAARATGAAIDAGFEDEAIAKGMTVDAARKALFDKMIAAQSPEIRSQLSNSDIAGKTAGNHGWDKALEKAGVTPAAKA